MWDRARIREQRWLVAPILFFASLQFVLHHLDWPVASKMAVVLGAPAISAFVAPRRHVRRLVLSLVPLLFIYWLVAGGAGATSDTPAGTQVAGSRFWVEVVNLGMQSAAFAIAYACRAWSDVRHVWDANV